mmetsp:Transcript_90163/g.125283  ORF Transcript_90163/g.125283 Transcript_90163/m.125283 type:complete len:84 (+) Transcript_90163:38-289(+)
MQDQKPDCPQKGPYKVELKKGQKYEFCTCGKSANQPFCDGSHGYTGFQPKEFTVDEDKTVYLCGCKQTKNAPFCDGTHKNLDF